MPFNLQATFSLGDVDGAAVLSISGEIDIANKENFKLALHKGLAQNSGSFIVNLLDLSYADSTCIHALLHAQKTAQRMNKSLTVVIQESGPLQKIFRITGLDRVLNTCFSVDEALAKTPRPEAS